VKGHLTRAAAIAALVGGACSARQDAPAIRSSQLAGPAIVVNECMSGSSGWVELANTSAAAVDLAGDPATCWYVDDSEGGGAPRAIVDANVSHPAGSTTCDAAGRPATCALIAPGEHVWVKLSFINSVTPDACRLLAAPRSGGTCGTPADVGVGGPTASSAAGQCFGRQPDVGPWSATAIACTQGAPNPCGPGGCPAPVPDAGVDAGADAIATADATADAPAITPDATAADAPAITPDATAADAVRTEGADVGGEGPGDAGLSGGPPAVVRIGRPDRLLLSGTVVTPDLSFEGDVLIAGDTLACVAASCAGNPAAADATVIATNGIIFPGLIDTHNHILFDIFDETDWSPSKLYTNHNQWPNEPRYKAMVDTKQYLNGEAGSPVSIGCEMDKYGELKALIAGTTSVVGSANPANRACYGSLARTIDQSANGLPADHVQAATIFPTTSAADSVCGNLTDGSTDAYVIHIAEGVDVTARAEWTKLGTVSTADGCLYDPRTTIVHGTALGEPELAAVAAHGSSLVWSPRSNVFLYGGGTDLTKTANIPLALAKGINVALAPDWSIGGSQNLLDELRFADRVDNSVWGDAIAPRALVQMVTTHAARALGLGGVLGALAPGMKADVMVIGGDRARPYDALLAATPADVRLVTVDGRALYGDALLAALGPASPGCEPLDVCGASKFVCVAAPGGTAANKLGQTLGDITGTIAAELQRYDDLNLSAWDFSPPTPLVRCGR
jgi:cytosine/adenosine deaminase-related metal-dependent hydrolase